MEPRFSIIHLALAVLIVVACALIFLNYGWISFATFTERPGLNGNLYSYYQTNRMVFGLYELIIAAGALLIMIKLSYFVFRSNKAKLTRTFIQFAIFLAILILCEIYLSTRFVGKG